MGRLWERSVAAWFVAVGTGRDVSQPGGQGGLLKQVRKTCQMQQKHPEPWGQEKRLRHNCQSRDRWEGAANKHLQPQGGVAT